QRVRQPGRAQIVLILRTDVTRCQRYTGAGCPGPGDGCRRAVARTLRRRSPVERQRLAARLHLGVNVGVSGGEGEVADRQAAIELDADSLDRIEVAALAVLAAGRNEADAREDAGTVAERDIGDRIVE